jgi:hypothetical protein
VDGKQHEARNSHFPPFIIHNNDNSYPKLKFVLYVAPTYSSAINLLAATPEHTMSILSIAFPAQSAVPVAEAIINSISNASGVIFAIGLLLALAFVFKPLLRGVFRALVLVFKPKLSKEERIARLHSRDAKLLQKMARSKDGMEPNLAAELRALASRG